MAPTVSRGRLFRGETGESEAHFTEAPAMRLPRLRLTVRRAMVAVAIIASGIAVMLRPHPIGGASVLGLRVVHWSDGTTTKGKIPIPVNFAGVGPFLKVEWSDGGVSWYLGRSARTDAGYCREQAARRAGTLLSDRSEDRRNAAADWITLNADLIPTDLVVPSLTIAVNDPSQKVRLSVVVALERFVTRSPPSVAALAQALNDEDGVVRVMAAYILGTIRPEMKEASATAIPALARALKDRNDTVRCRAARSLLALRGVDEADPAVIEALANGER